MTIKILTLTPTHIGSGDELQGNFEYVYFQDEQKIAVVDPRKVLDILGEENMGQWIACIDNKESILPLIQQRKRDVIAADVASRIIPAKSSSEKPIRTQIYGGNQQALIPGSSVKGALRTALWAEWILKNPKSVNDFRNLKNFQGGWSDETVAKTIFGSDPNHDIFRLLQVGDITFQNTEVYETNVINKYGNDWKIKNEITQIVEALPSGQGATARISYNSLLRKKAPFDYFNRNAENLQLENLFPLVNNHTTRLIKDEIDYWENTAKNPDALGEYLKSMQDLLDTAESCLPNECIIRLGWGSGFRSMTGDWHGNMQDEDYYSLVKSIRPKHPDDLVFPKTTRFIKGGEPLGFIKLIA